MDYGIWLGGNRNGLTGYTDADFAGDRNETVPPPERSSSSTEGLYPGSAKNSTVNNGIRIHRRM
jgi:hypothetical protein